MLDANTVRRKVLLRMLGSPIVLAPFALGMSVLTGVWALGSRFGLGLFAGVAGLLAAAGVFFTRFLLDNGRTARTIIQELEQEERQARQNALDELDRGLTKADKDPRPENALRDLRALLKAFEDASGQAGAVHLHAFLEVRDKVDELFDQSVRSIEHTLKLGDTAAQLKTAAARKPILEQREKIIEDVEAGVRQLGGTLAALQGLGTGGGAGTELARLRDELDESLRVANRVEARLQTMLDPTATDVRTQPLSEQEKG